MSTLWQSSNCFKSWYWTLTTAATEGAEREGLPSGRWGTVQPSVREQRRGILSSFCLLAGSVLAREDVIQSSILSFAVFLCPPHYPTLSAQTILSFYHSLLFFLSLPSATSATHAHKRFSSILLAPGVVVWVNIVWNSFSFESVITAGIMPNAFSFLPTPIRCVRERNKVHVAAI